MAGWIGFLEASYGTILQWLYQYQHACTEGQFALIQTINGNAALWGMLMAPWAIRRFGKKRVLLVTNFLNVIFIASIYPIVVNVDHACAFGWCSFAYSAMVLSARLRTFSIPASKAISATTSNM